jgi:aldose 1-epimerase
MPDGRPVERVTIGEAPGVVVDVLTLGATAHRVQVTGGDSVRRDVALGRATVDDLIGVDGFLGATIGRYANRIANGLFSLDGAPVAVAINDRGNSLHGGDDGWDKRLWTIESQDADSVTLLLQSPTATWASPAP